VGMIPKTGKLNEPVLECDFRRHPGGPPFAFFAKGGEFPSLDTLGILTYLSHGTKTLEHARTHSRRLCSAPIATHCHPEAPSFGAEGSMHFAGSADTPDNSTDPSVRKKRGPQDDKKKGTAEGLPHSLFRSLLCVSVPPW
jgi:hypothetical protein